MADTATETAYQKQRRQERENRQKVRSVLEKLSKAESLADVMECIREGGKLGLLMLDQVDKEDKS